MTTIRALTKLELHDSCLQLPPVWLVAVDCTLSMTKYSANVRRIPNLDPGG